MHLGLIGYPLSHSFSRKYFSEKFAREGRPVDWRYDLFPLETIEQFPVLLRSEPRLRGLNVTIPYKKAILPYLDRLSPAARAIGAVNTIDMVDGRLTGYNTDVIGFGEDLDRLLTEQGTATRSLQALVLGTGGAAAAVTWVLQQQQIPFRYVSRKERAGVLTYDALTAEQLATYRLIVNTTPLGTHPAVHTLPALPYAGITEKHLLYDLVYNPAETAFLREGRIRGAATRNGLPMLYGQAEAAWNIWNRNRAE